MNNEQLLKLKESIIFFNEDIKNNYPFFYEMEISYLRNEYITMTMIFILFTCFLFVFMFVLFESIGIKKISSDMVQIHIEDKKNNESKDKEDDKDIEIIPKDNKKSNKFNDFLIIFILFVVFSFFCIFNDYCYEFARRL